MNESDKSPLALAVFRLVLTLALVVAVAFLTIKDQARQNAPVIVYAVVSYKPDKCIERVFKTKEKAIEYVNTYKENHEYIWEEINLKE